MSYQLEELIKDESLRIKLQNISPKAKIDLKKIRPVFPEYTPHDIKHKHKVIENLSKLIPIDLAKKLNQSEIFFLLSAAYVHDIGMCKLKELGNSDVLTLSLNKILIEPLRDWRFITENQIITILIV